MTLAELHTTAGSQHGAPPLVARTTSVHTAAEDARIDAPTARVAVSPQDLAVYAGAAAAAVSSTWLVYELLSRGSGALGFWLVSYAVFLVLVFLVNAELDGRLVAADRVVTAVVVSGAGLLLLPLVLIIGWVVQQGIGALRVTFFTQDLSRTAAGAAATEGGGLHAIIGTLEQVGLAVLLAVPLGLLTAVFLNEVRGPLRRPVRLFVDAMSGVPSIIAGLFIYSLVLSATALFSGTARGTFSGVAASAALTILMLPTITRTSEEVLRLVPDGLREASLAMGGSQWRTVWSVVLPTARAGLITSVVLGIARAVGETAPLLLTAGYSSVVNADPLKDQQAALPTLIYALYRLPSAAAKQRALTAALVLIALVLVLFTIARIVGAKQPGQPGALSRLLRKARR